MSKDIKALNYQTDSLVVINRVADALYQSSAFDQSLQNAIRIVQNYTSADMITFLEVNQENASLERRASENLVEEVIYQQPVPLEGSLSGLTISRQEIITSADIANDERIEPAIRSALDKHGLHFVISVPVTYQEQAVAVTNLFYCEMPNIPDRAYETLLAIGKILGAALKKAEIPAQELKQSGPLPEITSLDGLEIISDLAQKMLVSADIDAMLQEALKTAVTALNITSAYISEFDEDELKEKVIAEYVTAEANDLEQQSDLGESYPLDIDFRERIEQLKHTPYYIEDIDDADLSETVRAHLKTFGAKTVLGIPLIVKGKLVGLLDLWESRENREFTESEITIAKAIATQLAVSLNNSHLYEKTNQELQERRKVEETLQRNEAEAREFQEQLNTLQEVNIELARIDSLPELYEQIIVLARTKLGFDRIGLLLYDQDTQMMYGTFGTDDEGEIRDERYFSHPVDDEELEVFAQKLPFKAWETTELRDEGNAVGTGWHAMAVLWYEDTPIGWISADNLLKREPLSQNLMELMRLYASTIAHLIVRQRSEDSLRQKEAEARTFQEKLNILQEVNLALARTASLSELYEQVIILGREKLGFDRIGLLLYEPSTKTMYGTFGTDDAGEVRDEQYFSQVVENKEIIEVIAKKKPFRVWESTELVDEGKAVGQGWNAMAVLWYEDKPLGWIAADNFLKKEPLSSNLMELMRLFAITVAHLIVRQRSEDSLREREERARAFQTKLQALQETSIELSMTQSADELYRRAIELGQEKLGFKRLGLLLYDEKTEMIQGTFGTDIEGNIVDERGFKQGIWNTLREVIAEKKRLAIWEDVPLYNDSEVVGHGWSAIAVLWNGNKGLGWLATDNLLTQEPSSQEHLDLLMLYGDALGHLITQKESEQVLQERENLLQIVLDTIPQSVFWKDVNSVYLGSNRNFTRDARIESPQALIGKTDYDIVQDQEEAKRFWELDQRVIQSGESELNLLSKSLDAKGKEVWYSTNKVPLHDAKGEVIGILGTYEDITERRAAELELQRREEEYRDLYIDAPVAYVSLALDGTIEQANLRAAEILQVKLENLLGRKMGDFYADTPNGKQKAYGFADKLALGETILDEEIEVVTARGKELWIAITIQPNLGEDGKLYSMRAAATDITEQKNAEAALRNAELSLRKQNERLVDLAKSDAITSGDLNQVFREITETAVDVIDVARASIWYYEPDKIELADLFEQEAKAHSDGLVLYKKDYPSYFKALRQEGKIIANDAHRNSRTSEFSEGYLTPLGINSMLDTTAQVGGKTQAVLCLEHIGKRRSWTIEEQNFANSLSDLLALAMEANERQKAEKELQESLTFRSQQFEIGQALAQAQSEEAVINTLVNYAGYYKHVAISVTILEREEDGLVDVTKASNAFDSGVQLTPIGTRNNHTKQPLAQYYSRDKAFVSVDMADDERVGKRIGKMFKSFGIRSMAILPMTAGGEWIGNMTLMTAQMGFFNDKTLAIYRTLAEQGATSLRSAYLNAQIQETLSRREREVRVSTQIAQEIASATDLMDLYKRVVTQIQEQFGYYFTQLLRYDTALDSIALIEGYGEIGQRMVELNHSVPQGVGIIGTAAATGKPVLRPNVTDDPTWQPNPLLPNTKGELSVPIKIGDNVLGVLDVQSDKANQLNENDVLVLEGLCGQIAIAIESTTLRQDMENRLRELNALQRQMSKEGWQQYQAMRQDVVGYQYDHGGVHPLAAPAALRESNGNGQADEILNAPLQVRGETIGLLGIENDPKRPLTDDDREFLDAITREIAEALESARLFEQTQTALNEQERLTAELETVAQVSTAASTILEIDALLQSVVDLAKTSFGLYHAHIYLINENETRLQLKAGAGNIGRLMTLEGREIGMDTESLVARAARTRQGVLSNNVRKTIDYLPHPLLPKTQSELAVPMIVGDKLVGVMDLQSNELDFFSDEDLKIQRTLASQIAVAVENALQYAEQVQTASKLRELDQLKSEFLASMSHELRTPLNSIIGFADVLLEGLDGELNERMEEDVRLIRESGRHLRELIGDILDMSKIESGHMELRYEEINMPQLANDIIATASSLAQEKHLLLNLDIDEAVSTIQADRTRLRQILWNITGNAIKFTEKGSVTLAMHHRDDHILVSIRDTGIGIKEENISVVFEQFRQIDGGLNRTAGGTGLGMPITKKLVELHGGEIWIESVYGQGSTFLFTIPYDISKRRDKDQTLDTSGLDGI